MMPYGNLRRCIDLVIGTANALLEIVQHGISINVTNYKIVDD